MFSWRDFIGFLIFMSVLLFIVCVIATGFYMMCETGKTWGFALVVGGVVLGGGIAVGFEL